MHLTCIPQQHTGIEFSWMEHCLSIQYTRCAQQTVHDIRDPLYRTAYACASLCNVSGIQPLAHLNEPLRMSVDDRQWGSEFMGSHGDEITFLSRQPALVLETLLQRRGLFDQSTLAIHQSHCIVAENSHGARHFTHLIFTSDAGDRDFGILIRQ